MREFELSDELSDEEAARRQATRRQDGPAEPTSPAEARPAENGTETDDGQGTAPPLSSGNGMVAG